MNIALAVKRIVVINSRLDRIKRIKIPRYTKAKDTEMLGKLKTEVERRNLELAYLASNFPEAAKIAEGIAKDKAEGLKAALDAKHASD